MLSTLHSDHLLSILRYLKISDISRFCQTNHHLHQLIFQNSLFWKMVYHRDLSEKINVIDYRQAYQEFFQFDRKRRGRLDYLLRKAAKKGYEKHIDIQLSLIDEDEYEDEHDVVMACAARYGHQEIVDKMLKAGASTYEYCMSKAARRLAGGMIGNGCAMFLVTVSESFRELPLAVRVAQDT